MWHELFFTLEAFYWKFPTVSDLTQCNRLRLYKFMFDEFVHRGKHDVEVQRAMASLHKEVIQLMSHSEKLDGKDSIINAYAELVWKGMPFEILDGDFMPFPHKFLQDLFNCEHLKKRIGKRPLEVCSTVGPQSSGKSTLSNYRYGSRFGVSAGRCTRGIYGSFQVTDDVVMLVLDTEGLQSVEKGNEEFDRIMMLFILAASNHIDITIKGNMTEPFCSCRWLLFKIHHSSFWWPIFGWCKDLFFFI